MDLYGIIDELLAERNRIDRIITSLESAVQPNETKPGRRVKEAAVPRKRPGRKFMDANARREVSARMTLYWAQRREAKQKDAKMQGSEGNQQAIA